MAPAAEAGPTFDNPFVSSLVWSPDGEWLAYSVRSTREDQPAEADGLWLLNLAEETGIKLLDNRYLDRETADVSQVRIPQPVAWSPDGQALLVRMGYWEHSDVMWMEPLEPTSDDSNLHDPEGLWQASWSINGQSVWLTGLDRGATVSDLAQASRDQAQVTLLLDGDTERMAFFQAQELPTGLAFLAVAETDYEVRLYLGNATDSGFTYEAVGPANAFCAGALLWDIIWDPTGQWAAVICEEEVKLISLEGASAEDLTPFLQPLMWLAERTELFWGP